MRFLKKMAWERESQVCTLMPNFIGVALKMVIFSINLPVRENSGGRQKKLNIGAQTYLYTKHHNCFENYTASYIAFPLSTKFVIPKRDKQTDKNYHSFSSTAGARPTIPTMAWW